MAEIAAAMGLTESRISQIHSHALRAMEASLAPRNRSLAGRRVQ